MYPYYMMIILVFLILMCWFTLPSETVEPGNLDWSSMYPDLFYRRYICSCITYGDQYCTNYIVFRVVTVKCGAEILTFTAYPLTGVYKLTEGG